MPPRTKSLVVLGFVLVAVYLIFWHNDSPFDYGKTKPLHSEEVLNAYLADLDKAEQDQNGKGYIDLSENYEETTVNTYFPPITTDPYKHTTDPYEHTTDPRFLQPTVDPYEPITIDHAYDRTTDSYEKHTTDVRFLPKTTDPYAAQTTDVFYEPTTTDPYEQKTQFNGWTATTTNSAELESATYDAQQNSGLPMQEQFKKESDALGQADTAGALYGTTLNDLVNVGAHQGFAAASLRASESTLPYGNSTPYVYDIYPQYNTEVWTKANKGVYKQCGGPSKKLLVFSGHPKPFGVKEPSLGSYVPLGIDSNLCFERETRLGPYGFEEESASAARIRKREDWDSINWGVLQEECARRNSNRYAHVLEGEPLEDIPAEGSTNSSVGTRKTRRLETVPVGDTRKDGTTAASKAKARTAVLIRTFRGQYFSENDKQNIRALITELSLQSGGEYQVFLLVQIKDGNDPIWTDTNAYNEAVENSVPKEFWNMTVLWNDAKMKEIYRLIPSHTINVHQSQWLSVQYFAQEYPDFDFYWNWEFDSRYTGHYYDMLEKLAAFAKKQPRKYLWERNERYYIPSLHGAWSQFRSKVEKEASPNSIWGPPPSVILPVGPVRPNLTPEEDNYKWGVGDEADYISLAPIFDPVGTGWPGKDDVWGYSGLSTPRRASIGTQSRCSRLLLDTMHAENLKGNHVSSEMAPQTVALLHGLKAVYAPIPIFFDRAWEGKSLQKYFNPGPKGESGSSGESPFGWGKESRFEGSTWYYRATPPIRLYNNWLGWEDTGIGGPEWEQTHGRPCLPPLFLHPIKDVVKPPPGHVSKSELPYLSRIV